MTEKNLDALIYTAFEENRLLIRGRLDEVALKVRQRSKAKPSARILVFSDITGKEMDLDTRGTEAEMLERLKVYLSPEETASTSSGPGRPKLGVIAREVSLLPRHWEWLAAQPGGASAVLRRLVEEARKSASPREALRSAQESTHKFLTSIAGDLPGYEEALRALYAKDKKTFQSLMTSWPEDIRNHAKRLSTPVWDVK